MLLNKLGEYMKFVHLGDLHIGKSLGEFDLISDQKYIIDQVFDLIIREKVDAVLIAGDIYDRAIPSEAATRLLDYFLHKLSTSRVKTFIISGNHDSDERLAFGSAMFEASDIYISSIYDGSMKKYTVEDEYGEICIHLLPFVKASQVRHFYENAKIESYDDAVRVVIENSDIDSAKRNILVAHQFVTAGEYDPDLGGSEGVGVQSVGLVEKISYENFNDFDYVALGHIHSAQRVGRDEVRYSGSPLKYSLSEVNNTKVVPIITLGPKGEVKIEEYTLKPKRDMRHLRGNLEELLAKNNINNTEDFIYATLTNEDIIDDAMSIFQQIYPNTVKIDYDNSHTKEIENVDISNITENKTFSEVISEFYTLMYNCDISEEEMEIMKQVAKEAGLIDETN